MFTLGDLPVSQPRSFVRIRAGRYQHAQCVPLGCGGGLDAAAAALQRQDRHPEVKQSQAEYTAMAFREATGAVVIGSTKVGADGNVSTIVFPAG